jgi:hypothetical protein
MRSIAVGGALLLLAAASASAQVRGGLNELNVSGEISGVSADDETETASQLQLRYGRFMNRNVELGIVLSAMKFEGEDAFGAVGGFVAFHLAGEGATAVPYIGAGVDTGFGYDSDNPLTYGGFAGMKFFVGAGGALSTEAYLRRTSRGNDVSWTSYGVRVGVSIFL